MVYRFMPLKAEVMDYSDVKGFIISTSLWLMLWEKGIQKPFRYQLKETKVHQNVYMPFSIPESLFSKRKKIMLKDLLQKLR